MNNYFKLEDVADVKLSNVDKKVKTGEKEIRLCNYTDVYKNTYIDKNRAVNFMIASCNEKEFEKFLLKKGQVSITKDSEKANDIGVSTYIEEDFQDVVLGYHLALITPYKEKLDGKYLNYWFNTSQAKRYFENNVGGSGQRFTLPLDVILSTPLFLPNIENQKKISSILFSLDKKIQLLHQINDNLAELAKTIYDYWFVQFDFPDENGKPYKSSGGKMVYNNVLKREIPEGWEVKKLGDVAQFKNGINYEKTSSGSEKVKIINVRNISSSTIFINQTDLDEIFLENDRSTNFLVNDKMILITRSGVPGATRLVSVLEAKTVYSGFIIASEVNDLIFKNLIFYYLKNIEEVLKNQSAGTIMKNISQSVLTEMRISLPPQNVLLKFNTIIHSLLEQMKNVQKQNQELQSLRDWLLPMLMNGQISVE